ncbi:MAG: NADH-quinone oxidoreductase subunit C [Myxococcales bacterium]|nr:NADH-quinone oxidoreductase subunit C [Myxococcales bacterium]
MSKALLEVLEPFTSSSEESDYGATGIHRRHTTTLDNLARVCEAFLGAGYIFEMLSCIDLREKEEIMRLCYTFNSLETADRHLVHADIAGGLEAESFEAPSISSLARGADWQERETFEMYGVTFVNHPELERLLLPEDADFFPLRKDFGRIEDAEAQDD